MTNIAFGGSVHGAVLQISMLHFAVVRGRMNLLNLTFRMRGWVYLQGVMFVPSAHWQEVSNAYSCMMKQRCAHGVDMTLDAPNQYYILGAVVSEFL